MCVTVVLPTLDEAEALPKVVEELRAAGFDKILVVDGGSTDGTVEAARRLGIPVVRQMGRGKGMALRTALLHVDTPYVAVLDADYSYPPSELRRLLALLRYYDLVLGARRGEMPPIYRVGNWLIARLFNFLFGTDISDPLTGMYAARTDVLRRIYLEARGFEVEVDILAKALSEGARVAEVPITYRKRIGRKKLRPWHGLSIIGKLLSLAYRLNPSLPLFLFGALLLAPGAALGSWVAYELFYVGVPHYLLGMGALMLLLLGGLSLALLPLAASMVRLQASVFKAARSAEPPRDDCLPPLEVEEPQAPQPKLAQEPETIFAHVGKGFVISFMALLAAAAYFLGIGDAVDANKLAEWAYYALAGGVLSMLVDFAITERRGAKGPQERKGKS
ncbi:MAG: glycosyltransferase family 2 protein [Thermoproteus sp.]